MTGSPVAVRRALEIEDPSNIYVVHAIANRLTLPFARMGIPPNAVSLAGMACGLLAGVAYHAYRDRGLALLGFLLMVGWHVMDGVDGQLARLTRTHSEFGKVIDGICDYTTFGAVYVGLAVGLAQQDGGWVWALVVVAAACHAVQSAVYELQRERYLFWAHGSGPVAPAIAAERPWRSRSGAALPLHRRVADGLLRVYSGIQRVASGSAADAERRMAALLARRPGDEPRVRAAYREAFAPALRRWSILSANYRTLLVFMFAVVGRPIVYFWFEIFGLGAILVVLLVRMRARSARFVRSLETRG